MLLKVGAADAVNPKATPGHCAVQHTAVPGSHAPSTPEQLAEDVAVPRKEPQPCNDLPCKAVNLAGRQQHMSAQHPGSQHHDVNVLEAGIAGRIENAGTSDQDGNRGHTISDDDWRQNLKIFIQAATAADHSVNMDLNNRNIFLILRVQR